MKIGQLPACPRSYRVVLSGQGRGLRLDRFSIGGEQLKASWIFAIALLVPPHSNLLAQTAEGAKPCDNKPVWVLKVDKLDAEWDVSMVDRAHKSGSDRPAGVATRGFEDVVLSKYAITGQYFPFTEVTFYPCEHKVSLRTEHLFLKEAYGYSLHGKTFALTLVGSCGRLNMKEWIAAGCDTSITLIDTKGSGEFDLLRIGKFVPEFIPQWVMK